MDHPTSAPSAAELAALAAEHEGLLEFLYVCPVGLLRTDLSGAVEMMNPLAMQILLPLARRPMVENLFDLLEPYAPELRNIVASFPEVRGPIREGHRIHVGASAGREGEDPQVLACTLIKLDGARLMAVVTDISRQVAAERRLKQAESWFSAILTGVNDFALLSLDANGRINTWNVSGVRQTGFAANEVLGRTLTHFYFPEEAVQGRALQQVDLARRDGWHIDEGWRRRKDGDRYWCQSLVSALKEENGQVSGFSVVLRDVTEKKVNGDELRRLLVTDHLTGVANRARFFELAEAEEARWIRFKQPLSAIMIDADHFKRVNDTYGHAGGDAVLKALADACQSMVRSVDILGRLGGEEFAILLPTIDAQGAAIVAERLRQEVARLRVDVDGREVAFTISVGHATMGGPINRTHKLLKAADEALYRAKQAGRNRVEAYAPEEPAALGA